MDVVAGAGLLENRTETKTEGQEKEQWLAQRANDTGSGPVVSFKLAEPEDIDGLHMVRIFDN